MAWDDAPPDAVSSWDATPPTPDELKPSYLEDVGSNALKEVKAFPGSIPTMAKQALGLSSLPLDALKAIPETIQGKPLSETSIAEDVKPIIEGNKDTLNKIEHPIDSFRKAPISTAMTAAGLLGGAKGAIGEMGETVPRATVPEAPPAATEAPKGLPVMEPGAKTGDPHALFAYNDKFGPGGSERSVYNVFGDPEHPAIKSRGWGSSVGAEDLEKAGIPIKGRQPNSAQYEPLEKAPPVVPMGTKGPTPEPASRVPPDPNAPPPPKPPPARAEVDPLKEVRDYVNSKYGKAAGQPGFASKFAKYLQEESRKMGGKDIGLQLGQVKGMGPGFLGNEKAEALIDYARDNGYLEPGLSDVSRKAKIKQVTKETGEAVGAIRDIASKRGAPPIDAMRDQLKSGLEKEFAIDAPGEIEKVMAKFEKKAKENPTFAGMADLATELNKAKTPATKMAQHPGPTTEGANIVGRLNNEGIRALLNKEESNFYTQKLRDFGAHKKLEQAIAAADRKGLVGRGAPGSLANRLYQEVLDRGGYRVAGNVAHRAARSILKNPDKFKSLPDFFEELAHHADDVIDDAVQAPHGMAKGGVVPNDVKQWISARGC